MIVIDTDPNLIPNDIDDNGDTIYVYNEVPLTGVIRSYWTIRGVLTNVIAGESSYVNGYMIGVQTTYHRNGKMKRQWVKGKGYRHGLWQEWDENGNVTYNKMWIDGEEQP